MRRPRPGDDAGTTLLVVTALVVVLALAFAMVVDLGSVVLQRRYLGSQADAAALAGAQALDLESYYRSGARPGGALRLDAAQVRGAVLDHLRFSGALDTEGLRVESIEVIDGRVSVTLSAPAVLPFAGVLGTGSVPVRAGATARLLLVQ